MGQVTEEQLNKARNIDLHRWLRAHHPEAVTVEGNSLRLRSNHSISIKSGWSGWNDFSTGKGGDGISLLMSELGYSFKDAVEALAGGEFFSSISPSLSDQTDQKPFELPLSGGDVGVVYRYLGRRGIKKSLIEQLLAWGLLYASPAGGLTNVVFVNRDRTYWELRGCGSEKFCRSGRKAKDAFWYFPKPGMKKAPDVAFVCESAIDAMSLFLFHSEPAFYCSVGGVANRAGIEAVSWTGKETVLAVDNDEAGDRCREWARSKGIGEGIRPQGGKDWNEVLMKTNMV